MGKLPSLAAGGFCHLASNASLAYPEIGLHPDG
jgi:hypothetical protein